MVENFEAFPCVECKNDVESGLMCDNCDRWTHYNCLGLNDYEGYIEKFLKNINFFCSYCKYRNKNFDFRASLERLGQCSDIFELEKACVIESIFMPRSCFDENNFDFNKEINLKERIDENSLKIIKKFENNPIFIPIKSTGDGNCLFNSVSIAICGSESLATELRVRTCIVMNTLKCVFEKYEWASNFSTPFEDARFNIRNDRNWEGLYTFVGLSIVTNRKIASLHPPLNSIFNVEFFKMNHIFDETSSGGIFECPIFILWTGYINNKGWFVSNHFVPCVKIDNLNADALNIDEIIDNDSSAKISELSSIDNKNFEKENDIECINQNLSTEKDNVESLYIDSEKINKNNGKYLDSKEIVKIILSIEDKSCFLKKIPNGIKENVNFICILESNKGKKIKQYHDDCGAWENSSNKNACYNVTNESLEYIEIDSNGKFFKRSSRSKIKTPINPEKVYILERNYRNLKRDKKYKRRISHIKSHNLDDIFFIEYIGKFPKFIKKHGNSKIECSEYLRTDLETYELFKDEVKNKDHIKKIYAEKVLENKPPRDLKQLYNIKKSISDKPGNLADDIQRLISVQHTSEKKFIRKLYSDCFQSPCVILYNNSQLNLMKKIFKSDRKIILGVDRTFNIGAVYATLIVFQLDFLLGKRSRRPAILLGAVFLHFDAKYSTYLTFFQHIKEMVEDLDSFEIGGTELGFGSDEEKALLSAIKSVFPNSKKYLCAKHLKENLKRKLRINNINNAEMRNIENTVFKKLLDVNNESEFDSISTDIILQISQNIPLRKYMENFITNLKNYVWKVNPLNKLSWTNNACESYNHILKNFNNWKALKYTTLVENFEKLADLQACDLERAFYSEGLYFISEMYQSVVKSKAFWLSLSQLDKDKYISKFLDKIFVNNSKNKKFLSSNDGKLIIPKSDAVARKPGIRRRVGYKTTTIKKTKAANNNSKSDKKSSDFVKDFSKKQKTDLDEIITNVIVAEHDDAKKLTTPDNDLYCGDSDQNFLDLTGESNVENKSDNDSIISDIDEKFFKFTDEIISEIKSSKKIKDFILKPLPKYYTDIPNCVHGVFDFFGNKVKLVEVFILETLNHEKMSFCNSENPAKEVFKELDKIDLIYDYIIPNCYIISIMNILKCPYKEALEVFLRGGIFEQAKDLTRSNEKKEDIKNIKKWCEKNKNEENEFRKKHNIK